MLRKKFLAVATSAALAVSLCPGLAVAAPVTAGSVDTDAAAKTVTVQKKVKVKVLAGYDYTSKGLLKSYNGYKLSYDGVNLKSAKASGSGWSDKYTFTSSNGVVKKARDIYRSKALSAKHYYRFTYNSANKVTATKETRWSTIPYDKKYKKAKKYYTANTAYAYNNAGEVSQTQRKWSYTDGSHGINAPIRYTYKAGHLTSIKDGGDTRVRYVNDIRTWYNQDAKIVKRITKNWNTNTKKYDKGYTYTYKYETKKVPKSAVKTVQAQQWALLNKNLNVALGPLGGLA